jgi:hemerythrin superfamily protein
MDAITLLKNDHKTVSGLFRQFEKLGDDAKVAKRELVDKMIRELSVHAVIEELVFYPAVKGISDDLKDHVLESLEEHHVVKWILSELENIQPGDERFDAKVTVLIENVRHHVEEEENEFFPEVREALGRKTLGELGELLEKAKSSVPTHPHPKAPDEPPGNAIAGMVAGLVDRARDAGAQAVKNARKRGRGTTRPAAKKAAKKATKTATRSTRAAKKPVAKARKKATSRR